jgi:cyclopropane fatty-acyl-phospholipid synthase-like methyltransferase
MSNNKITNNVFGTVADKILKSGAEKGGGKNDFTNFDKDFILKHTNADSQILDLGSGSGLIINKIEPYVRSITCVELFPEFSKFIKQSDKIEVITANLLNFKINKQFDVVTSFGVMHYFDENEVHKIYESCLAMTKKDGVFIVKNQFGIEQKVVFDGFSKELERYYHAFYRQVDDEVRLLEQVGFKVVEKFDIYPPRCNRWDNTHFYALVAHNI